MLARIRKAQQENEGGFTLIELLVVMIIIGILAAIAIPVFLSQRTKAQDSAAKADVSTIGKEIATYFVDNTLAPTSIVDTSGRYVLQGAAAGGVTPAPVDLGKVSTNVSITNVNFNATTPSTAWCVGVNNPSGDKKLWKYSAAGGLSTGACAAPADF